MSGETRAESKFVGVSVSKGIAHGEAFVMLEKSIEAPAYEIEPGDKPGEMSRFKNAILETKKQIEQTKSELAKSVGESEAAIFDAHLMVLEDVAIMEETVNFFNSTNYNIAYCYSRAVDKFIEAFEKIDDPFVRERISDLRDVSKRMMGNLLGRKIDKLGMFPEPVVLVSNDFSPSDFALADKSKILAIVTEKGSQTSHTAILARSLGVPCVVGIKNAHLVISSGEFLLVDGYKGQVIVNPADSTLGHYTEMESLYRRAKKIFDAEIECPSKTSDGESFSVELNVNSADDIPEGAFSYCDGVGLFRTENFFLDYGSFPGEDVQYEAYAKIARAAGGKKVIIRTLDLGGDKNFALLKEAHSEENPFMGYRAIRFCLDHSDIFLEQLRAILRASAHGDVRIMLPMISSVMEVESARFLIERAKEDLSKKNIPFNKDIKVGAMIEIPSAAITTDVIVKACDFISIGTNDLIQYLLAVDRVNDRVAQLYNPAHPAVIRTLDMVVSVARQAGVPVSVCGELASDVFFAPLLLGMGVTNFSMSARGISEIKFLLRKVNMHSVRELRNDVIALERSRHIMSRLRSFHYEAISPYVEI